MNAYLETVASPAGPLTFAVDDAGALLQLAFLNGGDERTIEEELRRDGFALGRDRGRTAAAREQIREYAAGTRRAFDLPLAPTGSAWQRTVWEALTRIPFAETRSYGQVAALVGRPRAARAVGRANALNRLPLVVPCHRVVGANGTPMGFAGGARLKTLLLAHEATVARAATGRTAARRDAGQAEEHAAR